MSVGANFDNRLIELVHANPSLYERYLRSTPYESNKKRKSESWCSIATSLETDVNTCLTRWNYLREKLRRELQKEHSDWNLLPKLRFVKEHKHISSSSHNTEHKAANSSTAPTRMNITWQTLNPGQLIQLDEDDALQEAMDEQHVVAITTAPAAEVVVPASTNDDVMKRIEALLQGLGPNRAKAEKKIVAYLCKCNLRALNHEQIDDIFI